MLPGLDPDLAAQPRDIRLRTRYGLNLLAVSRQGHRSLARLRTLAIRAGDVLLMQGTARGHLGVRRRQFGCVPLAERALRIPDRRKALMAAGVSWRRPSAASRCGLLPAAIAFAARRAGLDGAAHGAAARGLRCDRLAGDRAARRADPGRRRDGDHRRRRSDRPALLDHVAQGHAVAGLALILVVTMTLSDFMNNAATAAVMCPIAIGTAHCARRERRRLPDGGGDRRLLRLPHPDRPPEQHADPGARRLPLRRLLAARPAAGNHCGGRRHPAAAVDLALVTRFCPMFRPRP